MKSGLKLCLSLADAYTWVGGCERLPSGRYSRIGPILESFERNWRGAGNNPPVTEESLRSLWYVLAA